MKPTDVVECVPSAGRAGVVVIVLACLGAATTVAAQPDLDFEPELSANGLFLAGYTKLEDPDGAPTSRTGLFAQNLELHMAALVDTGIVGEITVSLPRGSRTGRARRHHRGLRDIASG